ncbi:hypothetical protein P9112_002216 [Eukaryota sp. TZLM1-RC]
MTPLLQCDSSKCQHCGGALCDILSGQFVCLDCGFLTGQGGELHQEQRDKHNHIIGSFVSSQKTLAEQPISTSLPRSVSMMGSGWSRNSATQKIVQRLANILGLSRFLVDKASEYVPLMKRKKTLGNRCRRQTVAAVCLFIACRQHQEPVTVAQLCCIAQYPITKTSFKVLADRSSSHFTIPSSCPSSWLSRLLRNEGGVGGDVFNDCWKLFNTMLPFVEHLFSGAPAEWDSFVCEELAFAYFITNQVFEVYGRKISCISIKSVSVKAVTVTKYSNLTRKVLKQFLSRELLFKKGLQQKPLVDIIELSLPFLSTEEYGRKLFHLWGRVVLNQWE